MTEEPHELTEKERIDRDFKRRHPELEPMKKSTKIKIGVAIGLVVVGTGAGFWINAHNKSVEREQRAQIVMTKAQGVSLETAEKIAELSMEHDIPVLAILEIKRALDTSTTTSNLELTLEYVVQMAKGAKPGDLNKNVGYRPDSANSVVTQKSSAAMNLLVSLNDSAKAVMFGLPMPAAKQDTSSAGQDTTDEKFQKSDKRFPKRIDPAKSKPTNQRNDKHRNDLQKQRR